jgi:hypothetical protein
MKRYKTYEETEVNCELIPYTRCYQSRRQRNEWTCHLPEIQSVLNILGRRGSSLEVEIDENGLSSSAHSVKR